MRLFSDYLLPILLVGIGYIGIQKLATKSHWSIWLRLILHVVAIGFIFVLLIYEYFAGKSLADSLRQSVGNAFCQLYTIDSCPAEIRAEIARRRIDSQAAASQLAMADAKLKQAEEERRKADTILSEAQKEKAQAETALRLAQEERKRAEEIARIATESQRPPDSATKPLPGLPPSRLPPESKVTALPPEDLPEDHLHTELPAQFRRQLVMFRTNEAAGTIVIDTQNTYLYLVLGNGQAMRYGVGVGGSGGRWSGVEYISRMAEWPDWRPTKEMKQRQPWLPEFMAGGEGNPLGARALYLGNTLYRIHGTNQPSTIGRAVTTGSIRLINEDIMDLYSRVQVGTKVVVLP